MAGKRIFKSPYIGIDTKGLYPMLFDVRGNFSVFFKMQNPCMQYAGDKEEYYSFLNIFSNLIRALDSGYCIQKHDVFSKTKWQLPYVADDFLMQKHFEYNVGRSLKHQTTTFILTCELKRSAFFGYEEKKYHNFLDNVGKVLGFFNNYDIKASVMTKKEITNYLYRYFSMDFEDDACSFDNFRVYGDGLQIGNKNVQCLSLVDVELIDMPSYIYPYSHEFINNRQFPHDLVRFIPYVNAETVIYNQVIYTVNQAGEKAKLEAKIKKHQSVPDPANNLCVEDITNAMEDIERNSQLLVYSHFDLIICDTEKLNTAKNQIESALASINIRMSKQAFNQYELFRAAAPGNAFELKYYDRFQTTADVAVSLMYKEKLPVTEESNLMMWFTNRLGVPIAIDPSDLPMRQSRIENRNKFVLGPSGSGKSFLMNTMLHQYLLNETDVVMVDVGHSYKGLCDYFNGRYITYSEDKPISMNPFYIRQLEYNIEKVDFLVNLILLLWKDPFAVVDKLEKDLISETVMAYYANYFSRQNEFTDEIAADYREKMIKRWEIEDIHDEDESSIDKLLKKIDDFIRNQRNKYISESEILRKAQNVNIKEVIRKYREERLNQWQKETVHRENEKTSEQLFERVETEIEKLVAEHEEKLKSLTFQELNFDSFYYFAKYRLQDICEKWQLNYEYSNNQTNKVYLDYRGLIKILYKFCRGQYFGEILNNDIDKTLFDEQFVVFEIDSIQNNETLFPIVTLVIMDVFIQKMRNKVNRKVIVIEEAWKALASPLMANYIKYLYKTVRKFYGEAVTVTQELDDIIKSDVVRHSIISNAATVILCDQAKFKDNFAVVAEILSLSEVEQNKIFTINALDNKGNRNKFKEFYIKRGNTGEVYGNEVSIYEYFTYTTEKPEKDAMQIYLKVYKNYRSSLQAFVNDLLRFKLDKSDFCAIINSKYVHRFTTKGITNFANFIKEICEDYRNSGLSIGNFLTIRENESHKKNKINLVAV